MLTVLNERKAKEEAKAAKEQAEAAKEEAEIAKEQIKKEREEKEKIKNTLMEIFGTNDLEKIRKMKN